MTHSHDMALVLSRVSARFNDEAAKDVSVLKDISFSIPAGGFVLSAHSGSRAQKADQLEKLRPGDHLSVLDAHGDCMGGCAPTQVLVVLPRGQTLRIDGEDTARSTNQLVLYRVGRGDGHTGTNQYGVEVAVRSGRADSVRDGVGNMAIPGDGFVLSANDDGRSAAAKARGSAW